MKVDTSKMASIQFFDLRTCEDVGAYPKVDVSATVTIDKGMIHHVNTDEIKAAIEAAVKNSVWLVQNENAVTGNGGAK